MARIKKILIFALLFPLIGSALAKEGLEIVIDRGIENTLPIAVIPFGWTEAPLLAPVDIALTISNDLARSGRFMTMKKRDLPQKPVRYQEINFRDWRLLGVENIVIGNLHQTGKNDFEIEFRLIDVYKGEQIAGFLAPSPRSQLRRTAHRISDIVYEKLTGLRGAFDTRIAYITINKLADGGKEFSLQLADADGFKPQVLLKSSEPLMSPAWSPDGKRIAYVSFEGRNSAVYTQDVMTGERTLVASNPGINSAPAWSPDGTRLALTLSKDGDPEIYVMYLSSGTLQRLTFNKAIDTEPDWSNKGDKIIFTSDRGGTVQIYEVSVLRGKVKRLTFEGSYNARARYSPDDSKLTMIHLENGAYRIALLDLNSGYLTTLTDSKQDESPNFAPNGSMIIYSTSVSRGSELAAVSADGSVHQRLALQIGEAMEPTWGPYPLP